MTTKPVKIYTYKNLTTYRAGKWLVSIERKSETKWACGMAKTRSWSNWSAINTETHEVSDNRSGTGGIKVAAEKLSK